MEKLEQNRLMLAGILVISAMSMIGLVDNLIKYIAEDGSLWHPRPRLASSSRCPSSLTGVLVRGSWEPTPGRPSRSKTGQRFIPMGYWRMRRSASYWQLSLRSASPCGRSGEAHSTIYFCSDVESLLLCKMHRSINSGPQPIAIEFTMV